MRLRPSTRATAERWLGPLGAVALPWVLAATLSPIRERASGPALAVALGVAVVALAAVSRRRVVALFAAVAAAASFDFWFTRPYGSFRIRSTDDIQTDAALLLLGALAGEVGCYVQRRLDDLRTSRHRFSFLSSLSTLAAEGEPVDFLAISTAAELRGLLCLRDCSFTREVSSRATFAYLDDRGVVTWGRLIWRPERWGLPAKGVVLPVQHRGEVVGQFLMHPTPGHPVATDALRVAAAYASQVGASAA